MKNLRPLILATCLVALSGIAAAAAESDATKYTLRYQFTPGETIRWEVVQRANIRATVSGTTQTTETISKSIKAWRVTDVDSDGTATFEHSVESVDMRQKFSGRQEVRYNSLTDKAPPAGFESVAESIGVTLYVIRLNDRGELLDRDQKQTKAVAQSDGQMTIPLPTEAIPVGHKWTFPYDVDLPLENGTVKKVKTIQQFTLEGVKTGVASIKVATRVLTPIHDPAIEAKLIQRESSGTVRFDIDAGRVLGQQMDLDRRVIGFSGEASSLHYLTQFTEKLLPAETKTAKRSSTR